MNNVLRKVTSKDEVFLRKIADEYLVPIYGDQTKALNGWLTGKGYKSAFIIEAHGQMAGLLSLKRDPAKDYVKISTLLIVDEFQRNKLGKILLDKSIEFTREQRVDRLIVTVSETVPQSVVFFLKNDFQIIDKKFGKYKRGVTEFIMERGLEPK